MLAVQIIAGIFGIGCFAAGLYLFSDAICKGGAISLEAGFRRAVSGLVLLAISSMLAATVLHTLYVVYSG